MTECPSCRTVYTEQPKFCANCGYQFASDPKANTVPRKKLTSAQAGCGCLSIMVIIVAVMIFGISQRTTSQRTEPTPTKPLASTAGNSNRPTSALGATKESKVMLYMSCLGFSPSTAAKALQAAKGDSDKVLIIAHIAVSGDLTGQVPLNQREKTCLKNSGL